MGLDRTATETRWIVLGTDGRHVSVGRHTDPTPEEIVGMEAGLVASGQAGWLAVMKGDYYRDRKGPELLMVRSLGGPERPWADAVAAFEEARRSTLAAIG